MLTVVELVYIFGKIVTVFKLKCISVCKKLVCYLLYFAEVTESRNSGTFVVARQFDRNVFLAVFHCY